jgi:hypothetical protein
MEIVLWCLVVVTVWVGIETHFTRKTLARLGEDHARDAREIGDD